MHVTEPERFRLERMEEESGLDTLAQDVWVGLRARPKWLSSKHLYRGEGGALFEQICELPEYYPTRTEEALLARVAGEVVAQARPAAILELGAGGATKTEHIFRAAGQTDQPMVYMPVDINRPQLARTAWRLTRDYPWLTVRALVGDLEQPLPEGLCAQTPTLALLLGGTIGNFDPIGARSLLESIRHALGPRGHLLVGTDRVKAIARIERAYNDSRGVTARFNLNVLSVLNRQLDADFAPERFRHRAFYDESRERIEMHLVAAEAQSIHLAKLEWTVPFEAGESLRTEISRKFTPQSATAMLEEAGFDPVAHFEPPGGAWSLWLARAR